MAKSNGRRPIEFAPVRRQEVVHEPVAAYPDDAGYDLVVSRGVLIAPKITAQIPTNLAAAIPEGYWGLLLPRSSTFYTRQLLMSPGVIDSGYRGEIMAAVHNFGPKNCQINPGERLFQIILVEKTKFAWVRAEEDELGEGSRGSKGFGSTGGQGK